MVAKKNRRKKMAESHPSAPSEVTIPKDSTKRAAQSIENETLKATTASKEDTPRKRKNVGPKKEDPNPDTSSTFGGPVPYKIGYEGTIRPSSPQEMIKYEGAVTVVPLTDEAVVAMLKESQQPSAMTQEWIRAHEALKAPREGMEAMVADRKNLRQLVARKLRDRARQVANTCSASKQDINASQAQVPKESAAEQDDSKNEELTSMREQLERVSLAHERLQKAIEAFRPKK